MPVWTNSNRVVFRGKPGDFRQEKGKGKMSPNVTQLLSSRNTELHKLCVPLSFQASNSMNC